MTPARKAAIISLGLILILVTAYFFFADHSEPATENLTREESESSVPVTTVREAAPSAVEVKVVAKGTGRQLSAATLRVGALDARLSGKVLRSVGSLHELNLDAGRYELLVRCRGYESETREVLINKTESTQSIVFELGRGVYISGHVMAKDGSPIAGAEVMTFRRLASPDADIEDVVRAFVDIKKVTEEVHHTAVTDEEGAYQIDGLEPIWYAVRAVADGYAPGEHKEVPAPSENVDITLDDGATLEGIVQDETGAPIVGAEILAKAEFEDPRAEGVFEVILRKGQPPVDRTTTQADGKFRLNRLGAGLYAFKIHAPGHREHVEPSVRLVPGVNKPRTFTLNSALVIQGRVVNPEGEPVVGAEVELVPYRHSENAGKLFDLGLREPLITDEQGNFSMDTAVEGRHLISVYHKDYRTIDKHKIFPSEGEEVTLQMRIGPRIDGYVVDSNTGAPVAGAIVGIQDKVTRIRSDTTDERGYYVLNGLATNKKKFIMHVEAEGYGRTEREVDRIYYNKERVYQNRQEDFHLLEAGVVSGRVLMGTQPAANALVEIRRPDDKATQGGLIWSDFTDQNGAFEITEVASDAQLVLRVKLRTYLDHYTKPFSLEAGENRVLDDIRLQLGGEIAGRVTDSRGNVVVGCAVEARPEGATEVVKTGVVARKTDADGNYLIQGLESGVVDLVFQLPGYVEGVLENVETRQGQRNTGRDMVLEVASVLAGTVTDPNGQPIAGAKVVAYEYISGVKEHQVSSRPNGEFRLATLAAKDHVELAVSHPYYGAYEQEEVPVNQENLTIALELRGVLKGFVTSYDGHTTPELTVELKPRKGGKRIPKQRYKDGKFEVRGIPSGQYEVVIWGPGYALFKKDLDIASDEVVDWGTIELQARGFTG